MRVSGLEPDAVGEVALASGIALSHLSVEESELEQSFLELIEGGGTDRAPARAPAGTTAPTAAASMEGGAR
jgi:ABC-2 type transport system ATP-binding protein